jgi:hypothetical protein
MVAWEFRDKKKMHDRYGTAFMLVTPGKNELWCADPAMSQVILARRKDFIQTPMATTVMEFLGPNIISVSQPFDGASVRHENAE